MKICIDAGHGGDDTGAIGRVPRKLLEKDVNLDVALLLESKLEKMGHTVVMTRKSDRNLSLPARANYANQHGADLFVSIHANSAKDPAASGIEVFHYEGSADGNTAARSVLDAMIETFPDRKNRGVKTANFHVLRETKMPSILVEMEFLTNPEALQFLEKASTREGMAKAIASGIQSVIADGRDTMEFDSDRGMTLRAPAVGVLPTVDCTPEPITIHRVGGSKVRLPKSGQMWGESHYVTREDGPFSSGGYPKNKDEKIKRHLNRSLKAYQHYDPTATFDSLYGDLPQYQQVWTPSEGGNIGQGSIGDSQLRLLTTEAEMWFLTMYWKSSSKPAPFTRFLVSANGKNVVCNAGFETGPGDTNLLGGVTWEVHKWLGTGNSSDLKVTLLRDQMAPFGPVVCE